MIFGCLGSSRQFLAARVWCCMDLVCGCSGCGFGVSCFLSLWAAISMATAFHAHGAVLFRVWGWGP